MRLILVPTAARPECSIALDVAFRLAKQLDANVTACHVGPERREPQATAARALPQDVYVKVAAAEATGATLDRRKARELFTRVAQVNGFQVTRRIVLRKRVRATWHDMVGTPDRVSGIVGPVADLSVRRAANFFGSARWVER